MSTPSMSNAISEVPQDSEAKRLARAARFASPPVASPSPVAAGATASAAPLTPSAAAAVVTGTCATIEKTYFRLTRAPDPATVRPLMVLRAALAMVKQKWRDGSASAVYAWEQLKSIRQDLTVQHIRNAFTVEVYETHARIAMEECDMASFQQCLSVIRDLAREGIASSRRERYIEFLAYEILHLGCLAGIGSADLGSMASVPAAESETFLDGASAASSSSSDGDASIAGAPLPSSNSRVQISKLLSECSADDLRHPAVVHAVQVNSALYHRDFYRFFQLWDAAPNMGVCIMAACVPAMRQHAARVFAESFRNEPPLERLRQILRFENDSDWTSFCELNFASSTQARGAAAPAISDMLVSAHHASPAATAAADRKPKSSSAVKSKKRKANP